MEKTKPGLQELRELGGEWSEQHPFCRGLAHLISGPVGGASDPVAGALWLKGEPHSHLMPPPPASCRPARVVSNASPRREP